jgi:hypothetical protein
LFVVPFMRPGAREALLRAIGTARDRVSLVVAGHIHHFSFRLSDASHPTRDVPILVAPSISPIFGNSPGYLSLDVDAEGVVRNVTETSYLDGRWQRIGDLASEGVERFTAPELAAYQARLEKNPTLVDRFVRLYMGGARPEISPKNFRVYWCAATALGVSEAQHCMASGGLGFFTHRALVVLAVVAVAFGCIAVAVVRALRRRRRRA